jgi:hypothetical protein
MPAGKAHGESREYQVFTENVIQTLSHQEHLEPYSGDGIDVPIKLGLATFTFDVALRGLGDRIVVAECKALSKPGRVKQGDTAEFAHKIELLRKHKSGNVAGVFFTKTAYQAGAIKHAFSEGIIIAVCKPGKSLDHIFITYYKYDPIRDEEIRHHLDYRSVALTEDMLMLDLSEAEARSGMTREQLDDAISSRKLRTTTLEGRKLIMVADLNEFVGIS